MHTTELSHFSTGVTGILDKRTQQIYKVSLFTLLHLGARGMHLLEDDPILEKEKLALPFSSQIKVLGVHTAPALFFDQLNTFDGKKIEDKVGMVDYLSLQASIISSQKRDIGKVSYEVQNLFQFLCKRNLPDALGKWLNINSNYLSVGLSPLSLMKMQQTPYVLKWFDVLT